MKLEAKASYNWIIIWKFNNLVVYMGSENIVFVSSSDSSLYQLETLPHGAKQQMTPNVFRAVQADISRNVPLANTILLKYISDVTTFSNEDLKGLCELLKLAIINSLECHPQAAVTYTEAAADCIKQLQRRTVSKSSDLRAANS